MEMEKSIPTSQVLEITVGALQTLDQLKETDVWFMEEGDDSVFYSDEDQTHQDIKPNTSCDFGAKKLKCPVNSEAAEELIPQRESDSGADVIPDKENVEREKEVSARFILAKQELSSSKTASICKSDSAEALPPDCTNADMRTQPTLNVSSGKETEEEKAVLETPGIKNVHMSSEVSYKKLRATGNREHDHSFHVSVGCHHNPGPGYSTLPQRKKSSDHSSFDHLTSSKYDTVSYRRIRKGNTRQKIEEFENMIIDL